MLSQLNEILTLVLTGLTLGLGLCYIFIKVPAREGLHGYRMARSVMGVTYLVFFMALVGETVCKRGGDMPLAVQQMLMITIGILQAFLFTYALTTLTDVHFFSWRRFVRETATVLLPAVAAFAVFALLGGTRGRLIFLLLALFYLCKMVEYIILFCRRYRSYERRMANYFSDGERKRLYWVKRSFFTALTVGVMALLCALYPSDLTNMLFTSVVIVYYSVFAIRFINYVYTFERIETMLTDNVVADTVEAGPTEAEQQLMDRLTTLMAEQQLFSKADLTAEEVAVKVGMSYRTVSAAINSCRGTNFKSWVNALRVEKAITLIDSGYLDKQTIDALINSVGFSSRSNFYRAFKACTGKSPSDYLSQMPAD